MESQSFFQHAYNRWLGTLAMAVLVVAIAAYAHLTLKEAEYLNSGPTTINVLGEGEVLAVPDIGEFTFAVQAEADDATTAQEESAEAINAITAYLAEAGVAERDIRTENYNLQPRYRYEERVCPAGSFCPPGERVVDGFTVNQTIAVKVRDTGRVGELVSGVGERGGTNISRLNFTVDDEDTLMAEARAAAIADAKEKAQMLADDLGVRIVRMIGYWEERGDGPSPYMARAEFAADDGFGGGVSPAMPTGENTIMSRVNITYQVE